MQSNHVVFLGLYGWCVYSCRVTEETKETQRERLMGKVLLLLEKIDSTFSVFFVYFFIFGSAILQKIFYSV